MTDIDHTPDVISPVQARTLPGLFRARVRRSPARCAYRHYDAGRGWRDTSWADMARAVARWQRGLLGEHLQAGERVAVMLRNCREWVEFDQAALGLGLVVVPLYTDDRPENAVYILQNAGVRLLLIGGNEHWRHLRPLRDQLGFLVRILTLQPLDPADTDSRVRTVGQWLPETDGELIARESAPGDLATIVYTSGTLGRPKGVMLSHANILWNAHASQQAVPAYPDDLFLSFLPLSHTFERTVGYYAPMMAGATVAYNRAVALLAEDLRTVRPTMLISVPRIYERIYNRIHQHLAHGSPLVRHLFRWTVDIGWRRFLAAQGRSRRSATLLAWPALERLVAARILARMGGRLRVAVCGGAPLPPAVGRMFIGLGLPLLQGYGLTECSPVISANRIEDNEPASVGRTLSDVQVRIGFDDELLVKSPGVMLGYWHDPQATAAAIDPDGWLHTGDKVRIEEGRICITGRIKDIIVLANGEKVPPADMEMAIAMDPLVEQVMVIGEARPYLSALLVLNPEQWPDLARSLQLDPDDPAAPSAGAVHRLLLDRIGERLNQFPGYAQIRRVACFVEPWTVDEGLMTPTLKLRRAQVMQAHRDIVNWLYAGH
ncbi:MAG: AMP-dependent synthetase/ligase [Gammaproteobacteria bacterium]